MDADRFDALSRALTTAPSRRTTLGALLGALLGSVLPGLSPDTRAAARKRNGRDVHAAACVEPGAKRCRKDSDCCATRCKKKKRKCLPCPTGTSYCASQNACVPGPCVTCPQGTADCDGNGSCATNTTNSDEHCGSCNNPCGAGKSCVNSVCTDSGTCDPACIGDKVCNGTFCTCPANTVQCEFRGNLCTTDANTDSTRCGLNCVDCATIEAGYRCCSGQCGNGCSPGTNGCDLSPCGLNCEQCPAGKTCCNQGPGTISQCVDLVGGFCPPKPTA